MLVLMDLLLSLFPLAFTPLICFPFSLFFFSSAMSLLLYGSMPTFFYVVCFLGHCNTLKLASNSFLWTKPYLFQFVNFVGTIFLSFSSLPFRYSISVLLSSRTTYNNYYKNEILAEKSTCKLSGVKGHLSVRY